MKRLGFLVLLLLLSGCINSNDVEPNEGYVATVSDENFVLYLYSVKDEYSNEEEVEIYGTLEYIGEHNSVTIQSGSPYMVYTVSDGSDDYIQGMVLTVLLETELVKGEVYKFPLVKSGGFSEDDPDADFWRAFYSEEKMLFPKGEYVLKFLTAFNIKGEEDNDLEITYTFKVR